jgi:hypothetical protein
MTMTAYMTKAANVATNKTTYNIEYVTTHGIQVPVINTGTKDKPKLFIAGKEFFTELGLDWTQQFRVTAAMKISCVALNTMQVKQTRKVTGIPYKKLEVLLNRLDLARIGKQLPPKQRATLVKRIEGLQSDINTVIEDYYHVGVVINHNVETAEGNERLSMANLRMLRKQARDSFSLALNAKPKKGHRAILQIQDEVEAMFEDAKAYEKEKDYSEAHTTYLEILRIVEEAVYRSLANKNNTIASLRRDINELKVGQVRIEKSLHMIIEILGVRNKIK